MSGKPFVVVSGLPASGKTTLARQLAAALRLPLFDKDDILETLFESAETVDPNVRQRLSRASDQLLRQNSLQSQGAVLVSFWRHPAAGGASGTPTEWLKELPGIVVEVHCVCAVDVAAQRFRARQRHPGHNDTARSKEELSAQFQRLTELGPLGVGGLVSVRTDAALDFSDALRDVRNCLRLAA